MHLGCVRQCAPNLVLLETASCGERYKIELETRLLNYVEHPKQSSFILSFHDFNFLKILKGFIPQWCALGARNSA